MTPCDDVDVSKLGWSADARHLHALSRRPPCGLAVGFDSEFKRMTRFIRGRSAILLDGRPRHPRRLVMGRQLSAHTIEFPGVKLLQRAGNPPVEKPSPHGAELRAGDFAQPVMRKTVG